MSLVQYLVANPELSDSEILLAVNALSVDRTDSARWHYDGLVARLGLSVVGQLDELLKATPGMDWVRIQLASERGLQFNAPDTQDALESFRPIVGDDLTDSLKAIGVWQVSLWQSWGQSGECQQSDIAAARAQSAREAVSAWWAGVVNEIVHPLIASGGSQAEILAAIAEDG